MQRALRQPGRLRRRPALRRDGPGRRPARRRQDLHRDRRAEHARLGRQGLARVPQRHPAANGGPVHAIDRIGDGPWYDRLGRLVAKQQDRPDAQTARSGADPAIINDLPNEDGVPNHAPDPGAGQVDNHDMLTGTNDAGAALQHEPTATCNDWTSAAVGNRGRQGQAARRALLAGRGDRATGGIELPTGCRRWTRRGCAPGVNLSRRARPTRQPDRRLGRRLRRHLLLRADALIERRSTPSRSRLLARPGCVLRRRRCRRRRPRTRRSGVVEGVCRRRARSGLPAAHRLPAGLRRRWPPSRSTPPSRARARSRSCSTSSTATRSTSRTARSTRSTTSSPRRTCRATASRWCRRCREFNRDRVLLARSPLPPRRGHLLRRARGLGAGDRALRHRLRRDDHASSTTRSQRPAYFGAGAGLPPDLARRSRARPGSCPPSVPISDHRRALRRASTTSRSTWAPRIGRLRFVQRRPSSTTSTSSLPGHRGARPGAQRHLGGAGHHHRGVPDAALARQRAVAEPQDAQHGPAQRHRPTPSCARSRASGCELTVGAFDWTRRARSTQAEADA